MGFPSGSVVPLPTANSHAKEKYLMKPAFQKAASPPNTDRNRKCVGTPLEDNHLGEAQMSDHLHLQHHRLDIDTS